MKRATSLTAATLLALGLMCCSSKPQTQPETAAPADTTAAETTAPDSVAMEEPAVEPFGVQRLKVEKKAKNAEFEAEIDLPAAGPEAVQKAITRHLLQLCGIEKPTAASPKAQLEKLADGFLGEAADFATEFEENEDMMKWSSENEIKLETSHPKFITYKVETYDFTGGAHGNGLFRHFCYDAATGDLVTWKKVFKGSSAAQMTAMVKRELKRQAELDSFDDFHLPEFVAFGEKGLYVEYDHYEIACYAAGAPSCTLPYSSIKAHLTDYGLSLVP